MLFPINVYIHWSTNGKATQSREIDNQAMFKPATYTCADHMRFWF